MPDRDLDITKFGYESYRSLKKSLGEFDAVIECNEIAIREFLSNAKSIDTSKYIQELSHKHKVKVNEVNFVTFCARIRQYYVVSVFQQFEQFLDDFKYEWLRYFNDKTWIAKKDGETKLLNTLENANVVIPSDIIDCIEYYRLIRNFMAHTNRDIKDIKNRYNKICLNKNDFLTDLNITAIPNYIDKIDFDDFIVLTNLAKHIAFLICINSKPSNHRIAEILFEKAQQKGGRIVRGLKKLKNVPERYQNGLYSYIYSTFGRFSAADKEEITAILKCLLA